MTPDTKTIRGLAEWITIHGVDEVFIALAFMLLFVFFLRVIFRNSLDRRLEEIHVLLVEIKLMIEKLIKE